jgi:hypothetical protein
MPQGFPGPHDPVPFFLSEFSEITLRGICRSLLSAYKEAEDECKGFPEEPAHDLRPIYRRAAAERNVQRLNGLNPGVSAAYSLNHAKNCYHVIIRSRRAFLTISCVDNPQQLVRTAVFRNIYSAQQDMFLRNDPPPSDNDLYAILLHGPSHQDPAYPSFMHIAFPNKDCTEYWPDRIDLMFRFSEIREQVPAIEDIPTPLPAKLRTIQKAGDNT